MDGVPFTFLGVHVALALATAGDADGLRRFADNAAWLRRARAPRRCCPTWPTGWRRSSRATTRRRPTPCCGSSRTVGDIGGSHAQREVFEDTVIHALDPRRDASTRPRRRLRVRLDRRDSASGLRAPGGDRLRRTR